MMRLNTSIRYVLILLLLSVLSCGGNDAAQDQPKEIEVYQAAESDIPVFHEFIGQLYGYKDIAIRARVEGPSLNG